MAKTETKTYHSSGNGSSEKNIIIVPGFSEGLTEHRDLTDKVAEETGAYTYTFEQPRSEGDPIDPIERLGVIVASKALEVSGSEGKIVAVAHSLGCAAVLRAVQLNPDIFESVILMQPPGLGPSVGTNLPSLVKRVAKKSAKNLMRSIKGQKPNNPKRSKYYHSNFDKENLIKYSGRVLKSQKSGMRVIARNPFLALREARAVGKYQIDADMEKVKKLRVPVHVVISNKDEIFDNQYSLTKDNYGILPYASSVSSVANEKAGHDTFWMQPKRTAMIVNGLLRQKNHVEGSEALNDSKSKQK